MVQLQVKKPRAVLFDISGTVTKTSFINQVLFPYITSTIGTYLEQNWDTESVREDIANLRAASQQDSNAPQIGTGLGRMQTIEATSAYVLYCADNRKDNKALTLLRFHMWFDGYRRELLETPVYSDVAIQLQKWRHEENVKLYVFSNGWSEATKRFLERTNHGNMNLLIEDHLDTRMGKLTDSATFTKVLHKIQHQASDVLFLTKDGAEGCAALHAGLNVVLVLTHRRNVENLDDEAKKIARVRSFNEIDLV